VSSLAEQRGRGGQGVRHVIPRQPKKGPSVRAGGRKKGGEGRSFSSAKREVVGRRFFVRVEGRKGLRAGRAVPGGKSVTGRLTPTRKKKSAPRPSSMFSHTGPTPKRRKKKKAEYSYSLSRLPQPRGGEKSHAETVRTLAPPKKEDEA